ncbi:MAG TPA: DUF4230 domain-containing protein [Thermoflexales bacterium]|nr:DUF4230 domain-containing protein [Thermoflexales bacterium]
MTNWRDRLTRTTSANQSGCLVAAGIVAVGIVAAGLIVSSALFNVGSAIDSANPGKIAGTAFAPATATVLVRPPAIIQVRALSDLTTASTTLSTIAEAQQARIGNILYERLVLLACGRVKAGIDLSKLREQDVRVSPDGRKVTIVLPKAELLDTYLIDDSTQPCYTRVYDRTNLILLPSSKDLEGQAREQALKAMRETALQAGVLTDADRNAKGVIERVLKAAGYETVEFVER